MLDKYSLCLSVGVATVVLIIALPALAADAWTEYKNAAEQAELDRRYERAADWYNKAVIEAEKAGPRSPRLEEALVRMTMCYVMEDKFKQAEPSYQRALALATEDKEITANPDLLVWLDDLADAYESQAPKPGAGGICYSHSIEIRDKVSGGRHTKLGPLLYKYSDYLYHEGSYKEALAAAQRAVNVFRSHDRESGDVMRALIFLGACQGKLGEYDAADKTLAQAMVLVNKYVMKSTYESAVLQIKGDMLVQQKKYKQAQAVYMEANRIDQQQDGPKRVNQGLTLHSLAELAKKEGNYSTAADYYRKEIALYATRLSPQATELVKPYTDLASVLRKLHRESDARQAEAMALKIQNSTASTPIPLKLK